MLLKILLIFFGIPILILPITSKIRDKKKTTKLGIVFMICVLIFTIVQIVNETQNYRNENRLEVKKRESENKADSLKLLSKNLADSLENLKKVLLSIDNQFYKTNEKLFQFGKVNDSLNQLIFLTDRPIFHVTTSKIVKYNTAGYQYMVDTYFANEGKRSATNVFGKSYTIIGYDEPEIHVMGTFQVSRTDVFPELSGFIKHEPLMFNPDSTNFDKTVYFYYVMSYSDVILKTTYEYEIAFRMDPIKKGKFINELSSCRDWEQSHLKELISKL